MHISATELNKHPGTYLQSTLKEPVIVEKNGKPVVVMVAYERYQEMEDAYWGELALKAAQEPSLSAEETIAYLKS